MIFDQPIGGTDPQRPVFICGCPRSGSTLLGSLLAGHPQCVAIPESQFFIHALKLSTGIEGVQDTHDIWCEMVCHWRFRIWNVENANPPTVETNDRDSLLAAIMRELVRAYAAGRGKDVARYWIDHTSENVRYLDHLLRIFPKARVIHLIRDGRGVAASVRDLDWGPNTILPIAHWWSCYVAQGLAAEMALSERILRIHYEDVVRSPEQSLGRIWRFLGIDDQLHPNLEGEFSVPKYTRAQHTLIGRAPDPHRLDAWRTMLRNREIERFEAATGVLLTYLGYEPLFGAAARTDTRLERAVDAVREIGLQQLGVLRHRIRRWRHVK